MPAYSFQKQFVPFVESGEKTHTIRGKRKARPKPGQPFYAYYAMRTKQCRKLLESTITKVEDIWIVDSGRRFNGWDGIVECMHHLGPYPQIEIEGTKLADDEMESLAKRDGFPSLFEMSRFWDLSQRFNGDPIHWKPVQAVKCPHVCGSGGSPCQLPAGHDSYHTNWNFERGEAVYGSEESNV